MKKIICTLAALLTAAAFCGCTGSKEDVSKRESMASGAQSVVSGVKSDAGEMMEDIGEAVTDAVSAVTSEADRMFENGEISDGDGVIGNEGEDATDSTD